MRRSLALLEFFLEYLTLSDGTSICPEESVNKASKINRTNKTVPARILKDVCILLCKGSCSPWKLIRTSRVQYGVNEAQCLLSAMMENRE